MRDPAPRAACISCSACPLEPLCRPVQVGGFPPVAQVRLHVARGAPVEGPWPGASLYAVRVGALKETIDDGVGDPHVVRFLFPADVAGLRSLDPGDAPATRLTALEESELCAIAGYSARLRADLSVPVASRLRALLSRQVARADAHATLLARRDAAARVARFLLDLAGSAHDGDGEAGVLLRLPMGRRDLGDHLHLTVETTSRILGDFESRGWITRVRGGARLHRRHALEEAARGAQRRGASARAASRG